MSCLDAGTVLTVLWPTVLCPTIEACIFVTYLSERRYKTAQERLGGHVETSVLTSNHRLHNLVRPVENSYCNLLPNDVYHYTAIVFTTFA